MNRLEHNTVKTETSHTQWFNSTFGREITGALAVKFLLLALLWWFFFAGNKQPVSDELVANKLLGGGQTVTSSTHPKEIR
jgi:hypothetical protein